MKIWQTAAALGLALVLHSTASAKTLVNCIVGPPEGFDPALYTGETTLESSARTIYNRLVDFERGTTNIVPSLAEDWKISRDIRRYTFKLRKGVKFHSTDYFTPTRDFNADDVIFSFARQFDELHDWHRYKQGANWRYFDGMNMRNLIRSIEKVDDMTVRFVLTKADSSFLSKIAMGFASVMSKEYADQLAKAGKMGQINNLPIGTGPYIFADYEADKRVKYHGNKQYWNGEQRINNLVFDITKDADEQLKKLVSGACHVAPHPRLDQLADLRANPDVTLLELEGLNVGYITINTQLPPFNNKIVRQALNMAIDKEAILKEVFDGAAKTAKTPIPPTLWSHHKRLEPYPYDPEKAKKLLEREGVAGLKTKIWALPVVRPYNPNGQKTAELIKADLAKVGVDVEIITYAWDEYLTRSLSAERDGLIQLGWIADNGDPDNFMGILLTCAGLGVTNRSRWCHQQYDDLIREARQIANPAERTRIYKKAQEIVREEAPWVPLVHSLTYVAIRNEVKNFKINPITAQRFDNVDIAEVDSVNTATVKDN